MKNGANFVLVGYAVGVAVTGVLWSALAAAIAGVIGLTVLFVWSLCASAAEGDRIMTAARSAERDPKEAK